MLLKSPVRPIDALKLSAGTAAFLAILKLIFAYLTNSVAILSLALDSIGDLMSSLFSLFFMKEAEKPADAEHPYGHGKFENIATFIQGFILIGSAILVSYRAVGKLLAHEETTKVGLGILVVIICFVVSYIVGKKVDSVGVQNDSSLLKVEALHLLMDSYLYLVVLISLILSWVGFSIFDPIASLGVAGYIAWVSGKVLKSSFDVLTDRALETSENEEIIRIIKDHYPTILGYDRFQSRKSGSKKMINFRLFICRKISLGRAHDVVDHIEQEIHKKIHNSDVFIHPEPTKEDCSKHEHELHPRHFSEN